MYDVAVLGAGAAGLALVKSALKSGLRVVLIEKDKAEFGGTCINKGCIPTKFLLKASHSGHDWESLKLAKDELIQKIKNPLLTYLEKGGLKIVWGHAQFHDDHTIRVNGEDVVAKNIVIATGSKPRQIISHKNAVAGEEFLSLKNLPSQPLIVGAGYIGIEFASLLNNFQRPVTVIEKEDRILPSLDFVLTQRLRTYLQKKGIKIVTGVEISQYNLDEFDSIICCVGRVPNTEGMNLNKLGIVNERGWVITDEHMRTPVPCVYACGDVTGKKLLAYVGEYQAKVCLENIQGRQIKEDYTGIAECVFSIPQVAKVGLLVDEAKTKNIAARVLQSNFFKFSSAYVYDDLDGFVQVTIDENEKIIGAAVISNAACELISIFSLAVRNNLSLQDLQSCYFVHPSMSEVIPALLRE